jgi:hypothetical protein
VRYLDHAAFTARLKQDSGAKAALIRGLDLNLE